MRPVLFLIGAISMAMANPFPTARYDLEGYGVEGPAGQGSGYNYLPEVSYNDNQPLAEIPTGSDDPIAYSGSGEDTTVDGYDNTNLENVNGYDLAKNFLSQSDKKFNNFQCGAESSVCCLDQVIAPVTQDFLCEMKPTLTPDRPSLCVRPKYFTTCEEYTAFVKKRHISESAGTESVYTQDPDLDKGISCFSDCEKAAARDGQKEGIQIDPAPASQ